MASDATMLHMANRGRIRLLKTNYIMFDNNTILAAVISVIVLQLVFVTFSSFKSFVEILT